MPNKYKSFDDHLQFAKTELLDYMTERKNEYNLQLSQSLNNPATSAKTYWAILKTFLQR